MSQSKEERRDNRSVMPLDVRGWRATMHESARRAAVDGRIQVLLRRRSQDRGLQVDL